MKLMIIKIDFEQKFKKKKNFKKKEDKYFYMFCNNGSQEV